MDTARAERTPSTRPAHRSRIALTASPLLSKGQKKRKRKQKASTEYWSVRTILQEKTVRGEIFYLIDWDDHPDTGESFEPTWEPDRHVLPAAIAEWEQKKQSRRAFNSRERSSTFDSDSEPVRARKRQRRQTSLSSSPIATENPSRLQSTSRDRAPTKNRPHLREKVLEIPDSYEEEQNPSNDSERVLVLVPQIDDTFDRGAYAIPAATSSQPSQETLDPSSFTPYKNPTPRIRHPFIWDEPAPVIPDSQEPPGSSTYEPDTTISQDTQSQSIYISEASGDPVSAHSEPTSYQPRQLDEPEPISSGTPPIAEAPSNPPQQARPSTPNQPIHWQQAEISRQPSFDRSQSSPLRSNRRALLSSSRLIACARSASPAIQVRGTRPTTEKPGAHPSQQDSHSVDVEDLPVQTQVPLSTGEEYSSTFCEERHGLLSQPIEETTQTPQQSQPLPAQNPDSEESWQAAQIRSPPPADLSAPSASIPDEVDHTSQPQLPDKVIASIEQADDIASPFHPLRSSGSPLPPKPSPSSNSIMADRTNSPVNFAEMLKQARATAEATVIARQAEARAGSGSAAPSTQPSETPSRQVSAAPITQPVSQMLPLRNPTEIPSLVSPSPRNSSEAESNPKGLQILPLGPEEYVVPLPLNAITRDIYDGELTNFRRQQKEFLGNEEPDEGLINEIDSMLDRLKKLCDHQDLILSDPSTQELDPFEVQAAWAENISTKCVFMGSFLSLLRSFNIHIAIVARPGRMLDILEAVLRKEGCIYTRPDRPGYTTNATTQGLMRTTLMPSDFYAHNLEFEPASFVIAFDSTFDQEQYPQKLRDDPLRPGTLAPLIYLKVIRSIEHFELCFDKKMDQIDRRAALVSCVLQSRHEVGVLPNDYYSPPAAGVDAAMFASTAPTEERSWPLRLMPDVDGIEFELDSSEEVEPGEAQPSTSAIESYNIPSAQLLQSAFKRSLSAEADDASSKRQRFTPVLDELAQAANLPLIGSRFDRNDSAASITGTNALDNDEADMVSSLAKKVRDLEAELQRRDASYAELRDLNQNLEISCKDLEKSVQDIQPKYQEALNDRGRFEHEMMEAVSREKILQQRFDLRLLELTKLRETKVANDAELSAARASLSSSPIPQVAEINQMAASAHTVRQENERLQKRIANMQNDLEYMRTNYQQASSAASEAVSELDDVKAELSAAQRKASDNARRIHEYQASSEIKQHLARIAELEAGKAEAERELEKKSDELKALLNGRRTTRGTSVPRSPRMGTMSPGSRPMVRVLSVGSRGTSPAPGDGPPYRGTFAGEALFTAAPGSTRWGNHLM